MFARHPLVIALAAAVAQSSFANEPVRLEPSVVSASALGITIEQMTTPAAIVEGDELLLKRGATLGESLDSLPGMRSSSFGAGAARPVIRGQEGARVKVLSDGVDVLDASTMSPDHAVGVEPLLVERIEILKGPATLLYGGGAIGGVVNVIDRKIPTYVPEKGYEGELELRANSVANQGEAIVGLTAGQGPFAMRLEGVKRQADPYEIPARAGKQEGSYNDNDSYNFGVSWIGDRGYLGMAFGEQNRRYGLLAHEHADCHTHGSHWHCGAHGGHNHSHDEDEGTPYIKMHQKRWDLRGDLIDPLPGFDLARLRVGHSEYRHTEVEGGEVGTRFNNRATDARLELTHLPIAGWRGVVGVQSLDREFGASGEEAYVPPSRTFNHALFVLEEYQVGDWRYELGLRREWQSVSAQHSADTRHTGSSASAGVIWNFVPEYYLGLSFSRSQRLPTAEELFAQGPHAATRTVELGNSQLDAETAHNLELSLRKLVGDVTFDVSLFRNEVDDYIYAADTGEDIGGGYRLIEYRQADAVLQGLEAEVRWQVRPSTQLALFGDRVRAKLRSGGDLPRIPAARLGVRVEHDFTHALRGEVVAYRTARQSQVADHELTTDGYSMLGASLLYTGTWAANEYQLYLKADNLLDAKVREHTSFIKDDVLQPGRNFTAGVRFSF